MRRRMVRVGAVWTMTCALTPAQGWQQIGHPLPRAQAAMAFDPVRGVTVLHGGAALSMNSTPLQDTWEFDGQLWRQVLTPHAPPVSSPYFQPAAMDFVPSRGRMLLVAAQNGAMTTWEYDGADWSQVATQHAAPAGCAMLRHDPSRDRLVLVDNSTLTIPRTWEFDGLDWSAQALPAALHYRGTVGSAFDLLRQRIVLFSGDTVVADTWIHQGTWSQLQPTVAPSARSNTSMTYDSGRDRVVLFGGHPGSPNSGLGLDDTWEFDGAQWLPRTFAVRPSPRQGHAMVYDSTRGLVVMTGGSDVADTWLYDGMQWLPHVSSPPPLRVPLMVHDPVRDRLVLFGGNLFGTEQNATWELTGDRWQQVAPAHQPPAGYGQLMVYDSTHQGAVLFDGAQDTWRYDGNDWQRIGVGPAPTVRYASAMVFDSGRDRVVLFGGRLLTTNWYADDTWEFDGVHWQQQNPPHRPPARTNHRIAYDVRRARTVVHGGFASNGRLTDTWDYDGSDWTQVVTATTPAPGPMTYDERRAQVVMLGGAPAAFDGADWRPLAVPPLAGSWQLCFDRVRGRLVAWGTPSELDPALNGLRALAPAAVPVFAPLGPGCAGSAGTPVLDTVGGAVPALGTTLPLQVRNVPLLPGLVALAGGLADSSWNGLPLPVDLAAFSLPGCRLGIAPITFDLRAATAGTAALPLPIPNLPALAGTCLGLQAFVFDPLANSGLGTVSNAALMVLN